ncbi:hypothetical protein PR202_gb28570 [Eleusine coracana subsp. coracana]|uniref:Uncharacterized protein n=1 Tax=Eleusine coracana subsp. coracana TaxID=191504 RepID=A0AAV5FUT3_ELECO|nr:hypothetical protein PR202_gb28570 [Eleusine coracana subsp. coracana]
MTNTWGYLCITVRQGKYTFAYLKISKTVCGRESKDGRRGYSPKQGRKSLLKRWLKPSQHLPWDVLTSQRNYVMRLVL